jgi:DNA-directed RNA polymerase subunit RPC12/RpoP
MITADCQPIFIFYFMEKIELNDFYNDGFGWICKPCEREFKQLDDSSKDKIDKISRLMREGEAESKQPSFSNLALAKWADEAHRTLTCPRCGITELVDKF